MRTALAGDSRPVRFLTYLGERFPPLRNGLVLLVYAVSMTLISAHLGNRQPPMPFAMVTAFAVVFLVFFQLRVCDEVKDFEHDNRWQPERPIPRGLISLREVVGAGIATAPFTVVASLALDARLIWALLAVWGWMALMTVEFFSPTWLRTKPILYMLSHMIIVPLITLFATACEWLPRHAPPPPGLALLLALSFANGCVNEIGRKIRAPDSERAGVETYTALWGMRAAGAAWLGCILIGLIPLASLGLLAGVGWSIGGAGVVGLVAAAVLFACFLARPSPALSKAIDLASGFWVLGCYTALGAAGALGAQQW